MTANTESTKRKLSLLQLAEEIGNVSEGLPDHGLPVQRQAYFPSATTRIPVLN